MATTPTTTPPALQCPAQSRQVGVLNSAVEGCGLEPCDSRYDTASIELCRDKCVVHADCRSFVWAPLGGDRLHTDSNVCTLYGTDESNSEWGPNVIMCRIAVATYEWHSGVFLEGFAANDRRQRNAQESKKRCEELGSACTGFSCTVDETECTVREGKELIQSPESEITFLKVTGKVTKASTTLPPTPSPTLSPTPLPTTPPTTTTSYEPALTSFYVYRAQDYSSYANENINVADLAGVLYYLQNEVVRTCPRKFNITRIRRLKMTLDHNQLGAFVAFDSAKCTVGHCDGILEASRYAVGCQTTPSYAGDLAGFWYSLPGACPEKRFDEKTASCIVEKPGGACREDTLDFRGAIGRGDCMYHTEPAGSIDLDPLVGISDYGSYCIKGHHMEYDGQKDAGDGDVTFWNGMWKFESCQRRLTEIKLAFKDKYPHLPEDLDEPAICRR